MGTHPEGLEPISLVPVPEAWRMLTAVMLNRTHAALLGNEQHGGEGHIRGQSEPGPGGRHDQSGEQQ